MLVFKNFPSFTFDNVHAWVIRIKICCLIGKTAQIAYENDDGSTCQGKSAMSWSVPPTMKVSLAKAPETRANTAIMCIMIQMILYTRIKIKQ